MASGVVTYTAQIRIKRDGVQVYQESQTFARKQAAQAREAELNQPGAIERANRVGATVKEMIERYVLEMEKARALGKTKLATLKAISESYLGQILVEYAVWRMGPEGGGVLPQTAGNDLAHLGAVLSIARPAWGYQVDAHAMGDARKLLTHFQGILAYRPSSINMLKMTAFALFSTRRQEEITRIKWADLDEEGNRVLVRDMKNPGQKLGNDVWCHLPPEAMAIIQTMPKAVEEIFPYNAESISVSWTRACKFLGIEDLHFHDLRHEGVSRLFEMDWDIPRVASVSGHRDWNSMRRRLGMEWTSRLITMNGWPTSCAAVKAR
ncbi:tyrosine-type recombinase/integrase [Pseudomonas lundensis]|uniref:tyrosine-type recombinase/integrase n=1 Tax=Pseudomonas lundensis TaxID=86185 RepID=UPI003AB957E1